MPGTTTQSAAVEEIRRLVSRAAEIGIQDSYAGKREFPRIKAAISFDLKVDPASASEPVVTYDFSEGGVSFWSKETFSLGQVVYLRDSSDEQAQPWLKVCVAHCTRGPEAYLIGCEFVSTG